MSATKRYEMREDSGASEIIESDSIEQALDIARDWAADGDYDERCMVRVYVTEIDDNGEPVGDDASDEVEAGPEPKAPPCTDGGTDDDDHDWQTPHGLVGGISENPGVWSTGGTSMSFAYVCARCGARKHESHTGSQRNPGELPVTVTYSAPTEASLEWVAGLR